MSGGGRIRLLHVTTGLDLAGAQTMLYRLVGALDPARFAQEVVSLTSAGAYGALLEQAGIPTHVIGLRRAPASLVELRRLVPIVRRFGPDVVQTWMYHADLLGGVAARLAGRARVVWGIHNSTTDPRSTRATTRWTAAWGRGCAGRRGQCAILQSARSANAREGLRHHHQWRAVVHVEAQWYG